MKWLNLVCSISAICLPGYCAQAAELVPNGGFEELKQVDLLGRLDARTRSFYAGTADSPFQGWAFGGAWEGGSYSVAVSDQAHAGRRSCQITCRKRGRGGIASSPVTLKAGTIIEVSLWVKAKDATGGRIFLNFEGTPGDGWDSKDLKTGTYDWTKFTRRTVVAGGQRGGPQTIVFFLYSTCEGSLWVDDFSAKTLDVDAMAEAPEEPAAAAKTARPIPEPPDSIGYRVNVVSPLEKVFREDDLRRPRDRRWRSPPLAMSTSPSRS